MLSRRVPCGGILQGNFSPSGDKSISHRAIMFGSLADGESHYLNFLEAEDCLHTMSAFQSLGVPIELKKGTGDVRVQGVGLSGLKQPSAPLYLGNSGTSMRLILGILSGQKLEVVLTGDPSLSSRPMKRVTQPLKQMGAQIKGRDNGDFAPLTVRGGRLHGIEFENKLASAQIKSALLFAGMYAESPTRITEPVLSRDHSERFLEAAGANLERHEEGKLLTIRRTERLAPLQAKIPGDPSAAAFFAVGTAITPKSDVTIENVCLNPTRTGFIPVLRRMGAKIDFQVLEKTPDLMGNIQIQGGSLRGTRITHEEIPSLIDELPILMIAMALADGESLISGASELRVKETDRIMSMVTNLQAIGGKAQELPDGCLIEGVETFSGGTVKSFGDHRTAMSFAIASLRSKTDIHIQDIACVATSFPKFFDELQRLRKF